MLMGVLSKCRFSHYFAHTHVIIASSLASSYVQASSPVEEPFELPLGSMMQIYVNCRIQYLTTISY